MSDAAKWDEQYLSGETPWDTGRPSPELQRVLGALKLTPGRALELGCGTGTNSVWLAQQGFEVTALDLSEEAIKQARQRAQAANVNVNFVVGDVLAPPRFEQPFAFFFDRGCYHVVRRIDPLAYGAAVRGLLGPGAQGLILAGNAKAPKQPGPPVVSQTELRDELSPFFEIRQLREFHFDPKPGSGDDFLAWSIQVAVK
jgi:SAM-dependent methyltransferase